MSIPVESQTLKTFLFEAGRIVYDPEFVVDGIEFGRLSGAKVREYVHDTWSFNDILYELTGSEITRIAGWVTIASYNPGPETPLGEDPEDSCHVLWVLSYQGWYNHKNIEVPTLWHEALRNAYAQHKFNGGRGVREYQSPRKPALWYTNNTRRKYVH